MLPKWLISFEFSHPKGHKMAKMIMSLVITVKKISVSKRSIDRSQTVATPDIHLKEKLTQLGTSFQQLGSETDSSHLP